MKDLEKYRIFKIKDAVEQKFGLKINYSKDCDALSINLFEHTGRQVSSSTLKRFWGIVNSSFNPSTFTLDTLAQYIGLENWNAYCLEVGPVNENHNDDFEKWNALFIKFNEITLTGLSYVKSLMPALFDSISPPSQLINTINEFLDSDFSAYSLISSHGGGKSLHLAKAIESLWGDFNPLYPDDIPIYISYQALHCYLDLNFDFEKFLIELSGLGMEISIRRYFLLNPIERKGKIILIIDDLNLYYADFHKFRIFVDTLLNLILTNDGTEWFKIIFACRLPEWNYIQQKTKEFLYCEQKWFNHSLADNSNQNSLNLMFCTDELPIFFENEGNINLYYKNLIRNPDIIEIICYPEFYLFFCYKVQRKAFSNSFVFLKDYMLEKILSNGHQYEKMQVIRSIIENYLVNRRDRKNSFFIPNLDTEVLVELIISGIIESQFAPTSLFSCNNQFEFRSIKTKSYLLLNYFIHEFENLPFEEISEAVNLQINELKLDFEELWKWWLQFILINGELQIASKIFLNTDSLFPSYKKREELNIIKRPFYIYTLVFLRNAENPSDKSIPDIDWLHKIQYFEKVFDLDAYNLYYYKMHQKWIEQYHYQSNKYNQKKLYLDCLYAILQNNPMQAFKVFEVIQTSQIERSAEIFGGIFELCLILNSRQSTGLNSKIDLTGFILKYKNRGMKKLKQALLSIFIALYLKQERTLIIRLNGMVAHNTKIFNEYSDSFEIKIMRNIVNDSKLLNGGYDTNELIHKKIYEEEIPVFFRYTLYVICLMIEANFELLVSNLQKANQCLLRALSISKELKFVYMETLVMNKLLEITI